MNDYLIKALVAHNSFRLYIVQATQTIREAQRRHQLLGIENVALGQSLIATLLLSTSMLKNSEILTTRLQGDGPLGAIIADGNAHGQVKGYLQKSNSPLASQDITDLQLKEAIGKKGILSITKDQKMATPFTGKVPLVGDIAQNYTYYLAKSEQIATAMGLSVQINKNHQVQSAGGFMLQTLPNATSNSLDQANEVIKQLPNLEQIFTEDIQPEQILQQYSHDTDYQILQSLPILFYCDCSKKRFAKTIAALTNDDLQYLLNNQQGVETVCKFCGEHYKFSKTDLQKIIAKK